VTRALYLFDIDGTLLRAGRAGMRALDAVFAARHGLAEATRGIDASGRTDPSLVAEIVATRLGRTADDAEIQAILDAYLPELARTLASASEVGVLPHVDEALRWLTGLGTIGLGIATGNVAGGARLKLEHVGLADRFAFGGYGCDSPDRARLVARAIERGRARTGACPAERIVVVGDTVHDVTAARACGVRVVAVATGTHAPAALAAAGPDAVLASLGELPAWHAAALP
jgi:phosphoglycolate phosphatase